MLSFISVCFSALFLFSASALSFIPHSSPLCFLQTPSSLFPLSASLSGGGGGVGGLLETAVGGQDHSRQQEGEEGLSGALKGRLAGSSSSFFFFLSSSIYLAHALS